jgi:flagellar basal body-associated protein FliL
MANPDPDVKRRNWIVLIVLVAVAAATYVTFMMKMAEHS